jgi:hypothetical protein
MAYLYETKLFIENRSSCKKPRRAVIALVVIALLFVIFTFFPPEIGLFRDPLTGEYGI